MAYYKTFERQWSVHEIITQQSLTAAVTRTKRISVKTCTFGSRNTYDPVQLVPRAGVIGSIQQVFRHSWTCATPIYSGYSRAHGTRGKNTVVRTSERARVCSTNFQYYLFTRCHTALRRCVQILYPHATSNRILYNVMGSSSVCIQTDLRYRVTDVQYYYRVYDTLFVVSRVIV